MTDPKPKPARTAGEVLREMAERAKQRLPPPAPPPTAPLPPPSHYDPQENDR